VDGHSRRLVHDDQLVVFIDDVEGYLLRLRLRRDGRRDTHLQGLVAVQAVTGLAAWPAFLGDEAVFDQPVRLGAGDLAETSDGDVQPLARLVRDDLEDRLSRQTGAPV
jgi:hypothetical protein